MSMSTSRDEQQHAPEAEPAPALFILQSVYKGERRTVADGVVFAPPNELVVLNWRGSSSVEHLDELQELYEKVGDGPTVKWRTPDGQLRDAEPARVVKHH